MTNPSENNFENGGTINLGNGGRRNLGGWTKKRLQRWRKKKLGSRRKNKLGDGERTNCSPLLSRLSLLFLLALQPLMSRINLPFSLALNLSLLLSTSLSRCSSPIYVTPSTSLSLSHSSIRRGIVQKKIKKLKKHCVAPHPFLSLHQPPFLSHT